MIRVSSTICCPVCGRYEDGCLIAEDGKGAICVRVPSEHICGAAGYFHKVDVDPLKPEDIKPPKKKRPINWSALYSLYMQKYTEYNKYHSMYGVYDGTCNIIPSYDGHLNTCGMMRVFDNGDKRWIDGSTPGLFFPRRSGRGSILLVCEGLSDTQTATSMRYHTCGRASATQSTTELIDYISINSFNTIVLVADNDKPGIAGANECMKKLLEHHTRVMVVIPPKDGWDLTDWVEAQGAKRVKSRLEILVKREQEKWNEAEVEKSRASNTLTEALGGTFRIYDWSLDATTTQVPDQWRMYIADGARVDD